jgi:hypothetical protein
LSEQVSVEHIGRDLIVESWIQGLRSTSSGSDLAGFKKPVMTVHLEDGSQHTLMTQWSVRASILDLIEENANWTPGFGFERAADIVFTGLEAAATFFSSLSFPLRVYRGVRVPPFLDLSDAEVLARAGEHWTPTLEIGKAFASGLHHQARWRHERARPVLMSGCIRRAEDVDWRKSGLVYLRWSAPTISGPRGPLYREDELRSSQVQDLSVLPALG